MKLFLSILFIVASLQLQLTSADVLKTIETLQTALSTATPQQLEQIHLLKHTIGHPPFPKRLLREPINSVNCTKTHVCYGNSTICKDICARGSVHVSDWLQHSLRTQRNLQLDIPLNYVPLYGSHNSMITYADGYGVLDAALTSVINLIYPNTPFISANQYLSITDQLNMGLRHIEIDVHWLQSYNSMKICHAGGVHLKWLNDLVQLISSILHITIEWDSETLGCFSPYARSLDEAMEEIKQWYDRPENSKEVLIFMFDNEEDLQTWNKVPLLMKSITDRWSSSQIFTPHDKVTMFPDTIGHNNFPTPNQLISMGKRLIFASRTNYGSQMDSLIFYRDGTSFNDISNLNFGNWSLGEWSPIDLQPYPSCTLSRPDRSVYTPSSGIATRIVADSLIYSKFYNGTTDGEVSEQNILNYVECNALWICGDDVTPSVQEAGIWSWDANEPKNMNDCVVQKSNGRWATLPCTQLLPMACQSIDDGSWTITMEATVYGKGSCPAGFEFSVPRDGFQNRRLKDAVASKSQAVWINWKANA